MTTIKTAIVGYGKSSRIFHLPFLKPIPAFEISAFVSSKVEDLSNDYPHSRVYESVNELAKDSNIDLAILCSPTFLHYEQAKILLEAGKHLVVEKPFTVSFDQAKELVELAKSKKLKLSVYQNRRWDSPFLTLKKLIEEGSLGEIYHYEVHYDRWRPEVQNRWREKNTEGSGILYDLGSHMIDQTLQLFGEPDEIISDLDCQRSGATTIDYFHLIFRYRKMRAILHASSLVQAPRDHLVVHGSKASYICKEMDTQEAALMSGTINNQVIIAELISNTDSTASKKFTVELSSYGDFYIQMAKAVLKEGEPVPVEPVTAIKTIEIIENLSKQVANILH